MLAPLYFGQPAFRRHGDTHDPGALRKHRGILERITRIALERDGVVLNRGLLPVEAALGLPASGPQSYWEALAPDSKKRILEEISIVLLNEGYFD